MPLKESYVIWNNKGGVGKSTLTFHIASHYSRPNPTEKVLVIDLCPQANVSMALLSSRRVPGSEHLSTLYNANKTISFYLQRSIEPGPVIKGREYLTAVHDFNDQMPSNLFLLRGDMYLELVGRHLEHERSGVVLPRNNPWVNTTSSIKSFLDWGQGRTSNWSDRNQRRSRSQRGLGCVCRHKPCLVCTPRRLPSLQQKSWSSLSTLMISPLQPCGQCWI